MSVAAARGSQRPGTNPLWLAWRTANDRQRIFWAGTLVWSTVHLLPVAIGWALSKAFTAIGDGHTPGAYRWVAVVAGLEIVKMALIHIGVATYHRSWVHQQTILRANLLAAQVASGGPHAGRPVASAAEAITHFRDDTEDIAQLVDNLVDTGGGILFLVALGFVLGSVDAAAAGVLVVPVAAVIVLTALAGSVLKRRRAADRAATAAVTGMVGDVMSSATTVKVNRADRAVLARLQVQATQRGGIDIVAPLRLEGLPFVAPGQCRQPLRSEGRADSEPLAPNDTPAGRALNRRVEIMLMSQPTRE